MQHALSVMRIFSEKEGLAEFTREFCGQERYFSFHNAVILQNNCFYMLHNRHVPSTKAAMISTLVSGRKFSK